MSWGFNGRVSPGFEGYASKAKNQNQTFRIEEDKIP